MAAELALAPLGDSSSDFSESDAESELSDSTAKWWESPKTAITIWAITIWAITI